MRVQRKQKQTWLLYAVLLTGMIYSALTLATSSAYAAECNCPLVQALIEDYCEKSFGSSLTFFECPYGAPDRFSFCCGAYCNGGFCQ